jgi:hypothetical protein
MSGHTCTVKTLAFDPHSPRPSLLLFLPSFALTLSFPRNRHALHRFSRWLDQGMGSTSASEVHRRLRRTRSGDGEPDQERAWGEGEDGEGGASPFPSFLLSVPGADEPCVTALGNTERHRRNLPRTPIQPSRFVRFFRLVRPVLLLLPTVPPAHPRLSLPTALSKCGTSAAPTPAASTQTRTKRTKTLSSTLKRALAPHDRTGSRV